MIHFIWATKNRVPLITSDLKLQLLPHIKAQCLKKDIFLDTLNCLEDHIHLLISLGTEQTISKVAQLIKGESSFWINSSKLISSKFELQDEYIALSVSESGLDKVRQYIGNQEEHHKKKTFTQEYQDFLKLHGLARQ